MPPDSNTTAIEFTKQLPELDVIKDITLFDKTKDWFDQPISQANLTKTKQKQVEMLADTLYKTRQDKNRFRNETSPAKLKKHNAELMSTFQ